MQSCSVAQKIVVKVLRRANELNLSRPLDESMTDSTLGNLMLPNVSEDISTKKKPEFAYINKELLHNEVSKKLLWTELPFNQ